MTRHPSNDEIEQCVLALLNARAASSSICPSDAARALVENESGWRAAMPSIRDVAVRMAREGIVTITQRGATLDPDAIMRGPIRLRRGPKFPASQ
jgi:hypothetical protein